MHGARRDAAVLCVLCRLPRCPARGRARAGRRPRGSGRRPVDGCEKCGGGRNAARSAPRSVLHGDGFGGKGGGGRRAARSAPRSGPRGSGSRPPEARRSLSRRLGGGRAGIPDGQILRRPAPERPGTGHGKAAGSVAPAGAAASRCDEPLGRKLAGARPIRPCKARMPCRLPTRVRCRPAVHSKRSAPAASRHSRHRHPSSLHSTDRLPDLDEPPVARPRIYGPAMP